MKKRIIFLATIAIFVFCSCNREEVYMEECASTYSLSAINKDPEQVDTTARKIIKTGEIRFQTKDVNQTRLFINQAVAELNGYISDENVYTYSNEISHSLKIRIVADKFDMLLKNISESTDKLEYKNIRLQDVTAEYIDVETRTKTKKELRDRYLELLKQATKVDEILNIEREIGNLQTEIEAVEYKLKYLKNQVTYSTLEVSYYQKTISKVSFFSEFADGIKNGWSVFLKFVVALSYIWVFIVIAATVIYFIIKRRRRKKRKQAV